MSLRTAHKQDRKLDKKGIYPNKTLAILVSSDSKDGNTASNKNDIELFRDILISHLDFIPSLVHEINNLPKKDLFESIHQILSQYKKVISHLIFYFSGESKTIELKKEDDPCRKEDEEQFCLLTGPDHDEISIKELSSVFTTYQVKNKIVLFDCSHSEKALIDLNLNNIFAIASCAKDEDSTVDMESGPNGNKFIGTFTNTICKIIIQSVERNEQIKLIDLYSNVYEELVERQVSGITPKMIGTSLSQFHLSKKESSAKLNNAQIKNILKETFSDANKGLPHVFQKLFNEFKLTLNEKFKNNLLLIQAEFDDCIKEYNAGRLNRDEYNSEVTRINSRFLNLIDDFYT